MSDIKLKHCPFCGKEAVFTEDISPMYGLGFAAKCLNDDCKIQPFTIYYDTKQEATEQWNKRVGEIELCADIYTELCNFFNTHCTDATLINRKEVMEVLTLVFKIYGVECKNVEEKE